MRILVGTFLIFFCALAPAQLPPISEPPSPITDFKETPIPSDPNQSVSLLRFPSAVTTGIQSNDTVEVELILPRDKTGKIPIVILLHYWGAADIAVEQRFAKDLNRKGIAAAVLTLPFHLRRTPPGKRSGEMAITSDPETIKRNLTQAVLDVRRLVDWITTNPTFDSERIAISGISLGAVVGACTYAVEHRIQSAALLLGGGDISHILFNSSLTVEIRRQLKRNDISEEQLRALLAPVDPLNFATPERGEGLLVIGARYDEVIPAEDTKKLITAFGTPKTIWINTGHYGGALVERKLYQSVSEFFLARFSGSQFVPPQTIKAPTLRVGIQYNTDYELSVAVGVDLWRSPRKGEAYVAGLLTTSGPMLFGARELGGGFAAGITITKRQISFGIFWGVVF